MPNGRGPHGGRERGRGRRRRGERPSRPDHVPAVPGRVQKLVAKTANDDIAPGHRFSLYFPIWNPGDWNLLDGAKRDGLRTVVGSGTGLRELVRALAGRAKACAEELGEHVFSVEARNTSPFVTGLGMEHPVENGFAFLNPYGLPYLPGASVKGALRRAAETLALADSVEARRGWDFLAVWWLFGFDATARALTGADSGDPDLLRGLAEEERKAMVRRAEELTRTCGEELRTFLGIVLDEEEASRFRDLVHFVERLQRDSALRGSLHLRGALRFWDVIPIPETGNGLGIDILTPHHSEYYQGRNSPHNSENPVPNPFLVLEPGARFVFHVEFRPTRDCPERIRNSWRKLVEAAFAELFETAGFGAKTSVGYGVFEPSGNSDDPSRSIDPERERARAWIRETEERMKREKPNIKDPIRSVDFARLWKEIEDEGLKSSVLEFLRKEFWANPLMKPSKKALNIYEGD